MAKALVEVYGCTVLAACEVVGLAHSSYYYQAQPVGESGLYADLKKEAGRYPTYGSRRLTHQLRRAPYHYRVNRKRIQRIMREKDLLRPVKRRKCRTTNSEHPYPRYPNRVEGLDITHPEQVWVCDIHLHPAWQRLCVLGSRHGRVHPFDPRLEPGASLGYQPDAAGLTHGAHALSS